MSAPEKCFVCERPLDLPYLRAVTHEGEIVYVGPGCHGRVMEAGERGYEFKIGLRLYPVKEQR